MNYALRRKIPLEADEGSTSEAVGGFAMATLSLPEEIPNLEALRVGGKWYMLVTENFEAILDDYWNALEE